MCIISHEAITASCEDSNCIINRIKGEKQALQNQLDWLGGGLKSWSDRFKKIGDELQSFANMGDVKLGTALGDFLTNEFDLSFYEEHAIELTIRITAKVEMPLGYQLDTTDFWFDYGKLQTSTDDVSLLSVEDPHISDIDINS